TLDPQTRINYINDHGGMAILNHPSYQIGWKAEDFGRLQGYVGFELYNAFTVLDPRSEQNVRLWHEVLNSKGWPNQVWAIAVDDAHESSFMNKGWIMAKLPSLTRAAVRSALEKGALYASNGPS